MLNVCVCVGGGGLTGAIKVTLLTELETYKLIYIGQ